MANNAVVQVSGVSKSFPLEKNNVRVLDNVSLTVNRGDFLSIMGPSGSGKSTLLYLIGGLDKVCAGQILLNGKNIWDMNDRGQSVMRRREVGLVFQFYNLIPNLNVVDNILMPAILDGKKPKSLKKDLDVILDITGLADRKKHIPCELSGGQQQRVAIARALITNPDVILADEPIGNLDSAAGTQVLKLLQRVNSEKKKTIIMVTHNIEATAYGNRVINIKDGKIIESA
ncbi:MAG: ABC transporter ATP-binding protein [Defluviitaleaceae bacterium]|nr:ABC transporter ATP-binding protein [Defluviitaleaceae bacterium]MCL2835826.1 ABC transporter ATP-binding protein [Defluviitaleaceae bacterium]